jgi:hypothetical protein
MTSILKYVEDESTVGLKLEDDLNCQKMEDDLNFLSKWKTTSILRKMEDNLNFKKNGI